MKRIVISLGGSVIVPDNSKLQKYWNFLLAIYYSSKSHKCSIINEICYKFDIEYLKRFRKLIISFMKKGYRLVIICGGGKLARDFQNEGRKIKLSEKELDLLGIWATRLNANVVKKIFSLKDEIIVNPTKKIKTKSLAIAAGWKPGFSTDFDAVLLAKNFKAGAIVNITNVDYVYDKDPKKHKNAKPIKDIAWKEFRKITGNKWKPGLNLPFDPLAAKEAERLKLKVMIVGKNLDNLRGLLENNEFKGTLIR